MIELFFSWIVLIGLIVFSLVFNEILSINFMIIIFVLHLLTLIKRLTKSNYEKDQHIQHD
jgi:hypothetical protein